MTSDSLIPSQLKFCITIVKNIILTPINIKNYSTWKSQLLKLFCANGFKGNLNGLLFAHPKPGDDGGLIINTSYYLRLLYDHNLASSVCYKNPPFLLFMF